MKKSLVIGALGLCTLMSIACSAQESRPWLGVHVGMPNDRQAAALTEVVGQLAGGIAHDFNNLLTALLGSTELLQRRLGDDHPAQQELATIQRTASFVSLSSAG
jgi:signal transduction histidine kinase